MDRFFFCNGYALHLKIEKHKNIEKHWSFKICISKFSTCLKEEVSNSAHPIVSLIRLCAASIGLVPSLLWLAKLSHVTPMEFSLSGSQTQKNELNKPNHKYTNTQFPTGQEKRFSSSSSEFEGESQTLASGKGGSVLMARPYGYVS